MNSKKTKERLPVLHHDSNQIRTSFLNKLGIRSEQCPGVPHQNYLRNNVIPSIAIQHGKLRKDGISSENSYSHNLYADCSQAGVEHCPLPFNPKQHKKVVRFQSNVSVAFIPSHWDYSETIRRRMWNGTNEIKENARRNILEYHADGCDWRTASEENKMYIDRVTGELIHPAHIVKDSTTTRKKVLVQNVGEQHATSLQKNERSSDQKRRRSKDRRRGGNASQLFIPQQRSQVQYSLTRWADT